MNDWTFWELLNAACRLAVALLVITKLTLFYDHYRPIERLGLGIAGGCALMTVPAILQGPNSPFQPWSTALFAFGVLIYFIGRVLRQFHHRTANREQLRRASARKAQRG